MAEHNQTGSWGENVACDTLVGAGYAIVERNWRMGHLEIDIVAMKGSRLAIVEVKTRSSDLTDPADAVDRRKMLHMVRSAEAYVNAYALPHDVQFDIITVTGTPDSFEVEHIPDAFYPPLRSYR